VGVPVGRGRRSDRPVASRAGQTARGAEHGPHLPGTSWAGGGTCRFL